MFVNIIDFPPVKTGKDREFREWFAWSNAQYALHPGFIRRQLLRPREGGDYVAIVEHESYESFLAMHTSPTQAAVYERVQPLLEGKPMPHFYETLADFARGIGVESDGESASPPR